jgi:hypothetical protein
MAGDPSEYRCNRRLQCEVFVIHEKSANPAEVYRPNEVLKIDIKDVPSFEGAWRRC